MKIIKVDDFDHIILEITSEGIRYVKEEGSETFIDFQSCFLNHANSVERASEYTAMNWKPVGQRDVFAEPPFIELFTDPVTRFEFANVDDCHQLQHRIRKKGWATRDLS